MLYSGQTFASPAAALEHHGVKGQKWGVRGKRPSTHEILNARANTQARVAKIYEADHNVRLATTAKGKASALKTVEKYAKQLNKSDDTRVAHMYTKDERVTNAIALGPIGLLLNHRNTVQTRA